MVAYVNTWIKAMLNKSLKKLVRFDDLEASAIHTGKERGTEVIYISRQHSLRRQSVFLDAHAILKMNVSS